jgi:hypothetical protein
MTRSGAPEVTLLFARDQRRFPMSRQLRDEALSVFSQWETGRMTCQAVQNWAKRVSTQGADRCLETVLHQLRGLDEYLITCDDLPVYRHALKLPPDAGLAYLAEEARKFDIKRRATDLQHDRFYGPHTQAILRDLTDGQ